MSDSSAYSVDKVTLTPPRCAWASTDDIFVDNRAAVLHVAIPGTDTQHPAAHAGNAQLAHLSDHRRGGWKWPALSRRIHVRGGGAGTRSASSAATRAVNAASVSSSAST